MINVIYFFFKVLHVSVVKFLPHVGLQIFRMFIALSNYLDDSVTRFAFTFTLGRYGPRVLAQHIDDGKYVVVEM